VQITGKNHATRINSTKISSTTPALAVQDKPQQASFTIVGNLGKDFRSKEFQSGRTVTRSSLAVRNGKGQEPTWYNIEAWNAVAAFLATTCEKGQRVALTGILKEETYEQDGQQKTKQIFKVIWADLCVIAA
jgi:single-strand DNA-binding protein